MQSPLPAANQSIYCSTCLDNWDHYADPTEDSLLSQALTTVDPAKAASLYNQADAQLWKDMATLPLFQQPDLFGWSASYGNLVPNTSNIGIPWNAQQWGMR